jgi:hypothetical protein
VQQHCCIEIPLFSQKNVLLDLITQISFPILLTSVVFHFTGSYPPLLNGLHLNILYAALILPFNTPYLLKASIAYSEHVG